MAANHNIAPGAAELLDKVGTRIRAELKAAGLVCTTREAHAILHEQAPAIAVGAAEQILLLIPHEESEDEDEAQEHFDLVMDAALSSVLAFIRRCFEEFGQVDEAALEATLDRSTIALVGRLQTLSNAMATGGHA